MKKRQLTQKQQQQKFHDLVIAGAGLIVRYAMAADVPADAMDMLVALTAYTQAVANNPEASSQSRAANTAMAIRTAYMLGRLQVEVLEQQEPAA